MEYLLNFDIANSMSQRKRESSIYIYVMRFNYLADLGE